ncbi:hypothetical protein [Jiella sp. M17.18]|uniref:hypothetical protein n=1 Tax=Jiella sp. M17.18 TaxID=3234247 RepID=UPI0034E02C39
MGNICGSPLKVSIGSARKTSENPVGDDLIRRFLPVLAASLCLSQILPGAAFAQRWRASGQTAGLVVDGALTGLSLTCTGSGLAITLSGFAARFGTGERYTVGVSVDGTAYLFDTAARADPNGAGSILVGTVPAKSAAGFVDALRKGKAAEVASPAGRYKVPLSGSGAALERLAHCGGS